MKLVGRTLLIVLAAALVGGGFYALVGPGRSADSREARDGRDGRDGRDRRANHHRERSAGVGRLMFSMVGNLVLITLIGAASLRAGQWYKQRRAAEAESA